VLGGLLLGLLDKDYEEEGSRRSSTSVAEFETAQRSLWSRATKEKAVRERIFGSARNEV